MVLGTVYNTAPRVAPLVDILVLSMLPGFTQFNNHPITPGSVKAEKTVKCARQSVYHEQGCRGHGHVSA